MGNPHKVQADIQEFTAGQKRDRLLTERRKECANSLKFFVVLLTQLHAHPYTLAQMHRIHILLP